MAGSAGSDVVDVLRRVLKELTDAGIDYMVVGSFASSLYGERRDTHDVDVVVALPAEAVGPLAEKLGPEYYFDTTAALEALERGDMFNIISYETGDKVDFWILADDEFRHTQFSRRRIVNAWGIQACVEAPEDTILSKLVWNRISPSERQMNDIRGILKIQGGSLDFDYLRKWAIRQGVSDELSKLLEEQSCQENRS
jgi:hypothetical protein